MNNFPELIPYRKGDKWGFSDRNRNIVVEPTYNSARFHSKTLLIAQSGDKYDLFNYAGELLNSLSFDCYDRGTHELTWFRKDEKYGFFNSKGIVVVPQIYDGACTFQSGGNEINIANIGRNGKKYFNTLGEEIEFIEDDFNNPHYVLWGARGHRTLVLSRSTNKFGYLNESSTEVVPCIYDEADNFSEKLAGVRVNNKWGFIDENGLQVISCIFDQTGYFHEGFAKIKLNGKWGFINRDGEIVIPPIYNTTQEFCSGLAGCELEYKFGFIDKSGNTIIPFIYTRECICFDSEYADYEPYSFSEDLMRLSLDGKYGFVNRQGNIVIPFKYNWAGDFENGLALVELGGKSGYINKNGTQYWEE